MRKFTLVTLILIVAVIVGLYVYVELKVPEIVFVTDRSITLDANKTSFVTRRLYSSDVDTEKFAQSMEDKLTTTQFTEEEILQAALAAGTPEFYPSFYLSVFSSKRNDADLLVSGSIRNEAAPGQNNSFFDVYNVRLEMITTGLVLENTDIYLDPNINNAPVISNDKTSMAVVLGESSGYALDLSGKEGTIKLRYTYDIVAHGLYTRDVMKNCIYEVTLTITNQNGEYFFKFSPSTYTMLEELQPPEEEGTQEAE